METHQSIIDRVMSLVQQLQLISYLGTSFARSSRLDEIYHMILASLVPCNRARFSRGFLFTYDQTQNAFTCIAAMGPSSEAAAACVPAQLTGHDPVASDAHAEPSLPLMEKHRWMDLFMDILKVSGSEETWLTNLDSQIKASCPLDERCRGLALLLDQEDQNSQIRRVMEENRVELVEPGTLAVSARDDVHDIFDAPALVVPIRTNKGIRSVIVVDRKYDRRALSEADKHYLEWFAHHVALIIENAELFSDLENAHNDLKQLDTLKSNFLSIISHELRTPLTAIMGFVDLLLEGRVGHVTEAQRNLLVRVSKNADHLVNMVNDLLEIAEIEAEGFSEIKIVSVDPLVALMNTLPRIEHRRADRNIIIEPLITSRIPRILSEERALERIVYHLIDNAVKFSQKNSKVTIEFKKDDDRLLMCIRDRGIGISQDQLNHIFEDFHQIDNRLSRSYGGMGLGLTVTRMLLSATGGTIDVESTLGVGSTFTVSYPIDTAT